jgi:hypothetical protein
MFLRTLSQQSKALLLDTHEAVERLVLILEP